MKVHETHFYFFLALSSVMYAPTYIPILALRNRLARVLSGMWHRAAPYMSVAFGALAHIGRTIRYPQLQVTVIKRTEKSFRENEAMLLPSAYTPK